MNDKKTSKKTCGKCRYYVKRRLGSMRLGLTVSSWGYCQDHRHDDLTGRGTKYLGLVNKNMTCQLPNIGLNEDWKEIVRATPSQRIKIPYSTHPTAENPHFKKKLYEREWNIERLKEQGRWSE